VSHPRSRRTDRDYVLGTHDAEVDRLGFQHSVWRDEVLHAWRAAGLHGGGRVVDIGAGPGFASLDLADIVGPKGRVLAVERSGRFLEYLRREAGLRGLTHLDAAELDLMSDAIPMEDADLAWCRWVACFVPDPRLLVKRMKAALRPGGRLVFHEYVHYRSYSLLPASEPIAQFVDAVIESWRAHGGEPDIGRALPRILTDAGLEVVSVRPVARAARPGEALWNWPAGFIRTNVPRLVELGVRGDHWGRTVIAALESAERDPSSVFITPTVLEIIARLP
jgi:SAM-dependent methyltransferase